MVLSRTRLGSYAWKRATVLSVRSAVLVFITSLVLLSAKIAHAQATLTWANPGTSPNIDDPGNWGGTAPNFLTDPALSDSAVFSTSTNTTVRLRNVTTGDPFTAVAFDANAPAYDFNLPTGNHHERVGDSPRRQYHEQQREYSESYGDCCRHSK